jgi:hypothetical protein
MRAFDVQFVNCRTLGEIAQSVAAVALQASQLFGPPRDGGPSDHAVLRPSIRCPVLRRRFPRIVHCVAPGIPYLSRSKGAQAPVGLRRLAMPRIRNLGHALRRHARAEYADGPVLRPCRHGSVRPGRHLRERAGPGHHGRFSADDPAPRRRWLGAGAGHLQYAFQSRQAFTTTGAWSPSRLSLPSSPPPLPCGWCSS